MVRVDNSANTRGDGGDRREEILESFKLSLSTTDGKKRDACRKQRESVKGH